MVLLFFAFDAVIKTIIILFCEIVVTPLPRYRGKEYEFLFAVDPELSGLNIELRVWRHKVTYNSSVQVDT